MGVDALGVDQMGVDAWGADIMALIRLTIAVIVHEYGH